MNGINGLNQQIDLQKLMQAMQGKGGKAVQRGKNLPVEMTKDGSIFNSTKTQSSFSVKQQNFVSTAATQQPKKTFASRISDIQMLNQAKSIEGVQGVKRASGSQATTGVGHVSGGIRHSSNEVDIRDIDFNNLHSLTDAQLDNVEKQLNDVNSANVLAEFKNGIQAKLRKVKAEKQLRAQSSQNAEGTQENQNANGTQGVKQSPESMFANVKNASDAEKLAEQQGDDGTGFKVSIAGGKKAVSAGKKTKSEAKSGTAEAEKSTAEMQKSSAKAQKTDKKSLTEMKKFTKEQAKIQKEAKKEQNIQKQEAMKMKQLQAQQKEIQAEMAEDQQKIEDLSAKLEEEQTAMQAEQEAQAADDPQQSQEMQSSASQAADGAQGPQQGGIETSASKSADGPQQSEGMESSHSQAIADYSSQLDSLSNSVSEKNTKLGNVKTRITTSQTKTKKSMGKYKRATGKAQRKTTRAIKQNKAMNALMKSEMSKSDKALQKINEVDKVLQAGNNLGGTMQTVCGLMNCFGTAEEAEAKPMQSNPVTAAAGAAMEVHAGFMLTGSTAVETAANALVMTCSYGQVATNTAKAAIQVAQGDIRGAFGSVAKAGSSFLSGYIAGGGLNFKNNLNKNIINATAHAATNAAGALDKADAKSAKNEAKANKAQAKGKADKAQKLRSNTKYEQGAGGAVKNLEGTGFKDAKGQTVDAQGFKLDNNGQRVTKQSYNETQQTAEKAKQTAENAKQTLQVKDTGNARLKQIMQYGGQGLNQIAAFFPEKGQAQNQRQSVASNTNQQRSYQTVGRPARQNSGVSNQQTLVRRRIA